MPELKNFCHQRGRHCEDLVFQDLERRGFRCLGRNAKYFGTEIDLLFISPKGTYKIIEVKSLKNPDYWHFRLSKAQEARLLRVHQQVIQRWQKPVELDLALVGAQGRIYWVPLGR